MFDYTGSIAVELAKGGAVDDRMFDQLYPEEIQKPSEKLWTPVSVAMRAASLLVTSEQSRILDVGSGCGKFCIVGALSTAGQFVGIEQRPLLASAAEEAARRLKLGNVSFIMGNMEKLEWRGFTGVYLFNPFYENVDEAARLDDTIPYSPVLYQRYLGAVVNKLRCLRPGTRVATYYGFGAEMPPGYERVSRERFLNGDLDLWVKD
ncbi:MAG: class I SAM-dependent methyltransferase [Nitrospinae bacterium]|nr:class I SAM-dependent methyltransferase [Nitrospinota bacterium]